MENRRRDTETTQPVPPQEGLYDDYYPDEAAEEERYLAGQRDYYARKDAYYAQRDAYYARRDAYYARQEARREEEEAYEAYENTPRPPRRKHRVDPVEYEPEDDYDDPVRRRRSRRRARRRGRLFRRLLFLVLAAALVLMLMGTAPVRPEAGRTRIPGRSTVLLAGTDEEGYRTDTLMLLSLDQRRGTASLLSIPRDTYAPVYATPKINSAYGAAGGGEAGMEELMESVRSVLGFAPDGYVLLDLDVVAEAVDMLGGVDFEVPDDIRYWDAIEKLYVDLKAGLQHLSGEQVLGLLRFRSGYPTADIGRTEVQRDFVKQALQQWLKPERLKALPQLWELFRTKIDSDLSFRQILWIARVLAKSDLGAMRTDVVPGWADMAGESSVYMVDKEALAALLPDYSPYEN